MQLYFELHFLLLIIFKPRKIYNLRLHPELTINKTHDAY